MLKRWHLVPGEAFIGGIAGSVLAVTTREGAPAVLKVGFPHPEAVWEAVGLASFPAGTAPRVLDQDAWTWSMLLDRVAPGTPLSHTSISQDDAIRAGAALLARISRGTIPDGIPTLKEAMSDYADHADQRLPGQSLALNSLGVRQLVVDAVEAISALAADSVTPRLLHGDYNPGNILLGPNNSWLAVDPKPLAGDPAFDLWPLVSQLGKPFEGAEPVRTLARHLDIAAEVAGVERDRASQWAFARAGLNVSWYLADDMPGPAADEALALRAWASVAGR
jgi:streptomycin 6-kinase